MTIKIIAASAYIPRVKGQKYSKNQTGLTLVELMVGLALGLLVVGVAATAMLGTRNVTNSVGDISGIQQQAAYVMRLFGTQLRQAGSLYLDLGLDPDTGEGEVNTETVLRRYPYNSDSAKKWAISEDEDAGKVTIHFTGYQEPTFANQGTISRNCLGAPGSIPAGKTQAIESIFELEDTKDLLHCGGNDAPLQPVAENVANFQVRYLLQSVNSSNPSMGYVDAAGVAENWNHVQGVQVCLVFYGKGAIDHLPAGTSYTDCDGKEIDITTLEGKRKNRMHYVFRNVFQLRSQGLV